MTHRHPNSMDYRPRPIARLLHAGLFAALIAVAVFSHPTPSRAQDPFGGLKTDDPTQPWHVAADRISYEDQTRRYLAEGHVTISKQGKRLTADRVRFDRNTMQAEAEGHAVLTVGEDTLAGSRMEIDLEKETGKAQDGYIFLRENHFHIRGSTIEKIGKETYAIADASVTPCDGDLPAWEITGKRLDVTIEGYGFVKHGAFWSKGVPLAYSPYFIFPAKRKRQSGLLFPHLAYSDRKGFEYEQPLFWAIGQSVDATLYGTYMDKRGVKVGGEVRYAPAELSKGTFMLDYLQDDKVDDGTAQGQDWGFGDTTAIRTNQERYWLRGSHHQPLPGGFFGRLDLDVVSDQDYLREFKSGHSGYRASEDYFSKYFNRELDDSDDSKRLNRLNVRRNWNNFSLSASANYYDNVIYRQENFSNPASNEVDTTLQKLPLVEFDASKQRILGSPVYYNLNSEYTYFSSNDNNTGSRLDVWPRVYLPFRLQNYLSLEPSAGVRGTAWMVDHYIEAQADEDKSQYRGLYDLRLDASNEVYGIYAVNRFGVNGIKHSIRPRVVYDYIPDVDQLDMPFFDSTDRIAELNRITYSVTNTLTSRSPQGKGDKDDEGAPLYSYREFARLEISQSYEFNEADSDDRVPFTPIDARLDLIPGRYLSIEATAAWNTYDNTFDEHNVATRLFDFRGDELFVEHRYDRASGESIYASALARLPLNLATYVEYERDIDNDENVTTGLGLIYEAQCWSLDVSYVDELEDQRYTVWVNLYGLGGLGQRSEIGPGAATSLDRRYMAPGYEQAAPASSLLSRRQGRAEILTAASSPTRATASDASPGPQVDSAPAPPSVAPRAAVSPEAPPVAAVIVPAAASPPAPPTAAPISLAAAEPASRPEVKIIDTKKNEAAQESKKSAPSEVITGVPIGKLSPRVVLLDTLNATPHGGNAFSAVVRDTLAAAIASQLPGIAISGHPPLQQAPLNASSGRIDGFRLAQSARTGGSNAFVGATLVDASTRQDETGFWWFKGIRHRLRIALLVELFDTATGTKVLDETFSQEIDIDEVDYDKIHSEKRIPEPLIRAVLKKLLPDAAKRVNAVLKTRPWHGFITSRDNDRVTLSAGSRDGLQTGNLFEVIGSSLVKGADGQQFLLAGPRIGVIRLTGTTPDTSEATVVSGRDIPVGATVRPLR